MAATIATATGRTVTRPWDIVSPVTIGCTEALNRDDFWASRAAQIGCPLVTIKGAPLAHAEEPLRVIRVVLAADLSFPVYPN
jgi:hypothetical protein